VVVADDWSTVEELVVELELSAVVWLAGWVVVEVVVVLDCWVESAGAAWSEPVDEEV